MRTTRWYAMAPHDELVGGGALGTHCLADPGKEYLVYKAASGAVTLDITGAVGQLDATWFNL